MVALVIAGFIMATVFQILTGQSRVVAVQGAREETQQNVRGALEIVSSELRAGIPQGILAANAQSITFMQPRAWPSNRESPTLLPLTRRPYSAERAKAPAP